MRKLHWYWGVVGTSALALTLTLPVGAQQAQQQQAKPGQPAAKPFDPCTGDGLPATAQTAPFAPGSPNNMTPPEPKSLGGKVSCGNGHCKSTGKNPYAAPAKQPGQPLSAAAQKAEEEKAAKQENAFPEAQSEAAQAGAEQTEAAESAAAESGAGEKSKQVNAPAASGAAANPFPEAQSRAAEKKAQETANEPPAQQGAYSSSNQRMSGVNALGDGPAVFTGAEGHPALDPYLAAQDDKVGRFYLHSSDWAGAYGRYKEATEVNPGDIEAVIGLAIAADHMGKRAVAIENYKLYVTAMPNGPHSKEALKALKRLEKKH